MLKDFILKFFLIVFVLAVLSGVVFASYFVWVNKSFVNDTKVSFEINIENGETFNSVYNKIYAGIDTPIGHKLYLTKILGMDKKIKFGYYSSDGLTIGQVLDNIANGRETLIRVTIPEGFNVFDIATLLDRLSIVPKDDFLSIVFDEQYVQYVIGEKYSSFEGFLFPGTYYFPKYHESKHVIEFMYSGFRKNLPSDFKKRVEALGLTFYDAIKLASIVQKETYSGDESPLVASVFYNRLKKGMRLQADPTIIYGRYVDFDGNIRKRDILDADNVYNTYRHDGLPPTPISNPSRMALEAVMQPADTDYIFFVANKNGQHLFTNTYEEHVNNVNKYQKK